MTTAVESGPACRHALRAPAVAVGRGGTLERRLGEALERLRATGEAECPVCRGRMAPAAAGGRCRDCGSSLR